MSIRHIAFAVGVVSMTADVSAQENDFSNEEFLYLQAQTEVYRARTDLDFKNEEKSPLVKDSIPNFNGLQYFDWDERFVFAASFTRVKDGKEFEMKTTTDRLPLYRDYATLSFNYEDSNYVIHAYQNVAHSQKADYDSSLFLPFTDFTNGAESYGGGRYLDIKIPKGKRIILDFNRAYNPYCAYNPRYSCPIPPDENKLPFRIEAGVLNYHQDQPLTPSMKPSE